MTTEFGTESTMNDLLLLSAKELAKLLRVSTRTIWRRKSAGEIPPPIKLGGLIRWQYGQIKSWISAGCPRPETHKNSK